MFTGSRGLSLTCHVKPGPSASFLASIRVASIWDLVLKSVWCNTWKHISPCFKTTLCHSDCQRIGAEPHRPYGPQVMEPPNLGWLGWWGQVDAHVGCQLLRADEALRPGVSAHEQSGDHIAVNPTSLVSAMVFYARGAAASVFSLFSHSQAALEYYLEEGIY